MQITKQKYAELVGTMVAELEDFGHTIAILNESPDDIAAHAKQAVDAILAELGGTIETSSEPPEGVCYEEDCQCPLWHVYRNPNWP